MNNININVEAFYDFTCVCLCVLSWKMYLHFLLPLNVKRCYTTMHEIKYLKVCVAWLFFNPGACFATYKQRRKLFSTFYFFKFTANPRKGIEKNIVFLDGSKSSLCKLLWFHSIHYIHNCINSTIFYFLFLCNILAFQYLPSWV